MNATNCQIIANASSVNMSKNRIDTSDKGRLYIDDKIVGLSISQ